MKIITLTILFIAFLQANAQNSWTYEHCLNYGLEHNLDLQQLQYNQSITRLNYRQSGFNLLPSVNAYASHYVNSGRSVNPADNSYVNQTYQSGNMGVNVNFNIFNGFTDFFALAQSKYENKAAKSAVEIARLEFTFKIMSAYLNTLAYTDFEEMSLKQAEVSKEQTLRTKSLYDMGKLSYADLLQIQAAEAVANELAVSATTQKNQAILLLAQLINFTPVDSLNKIQRSDWKPDSSFLFSTPDQIYAQAETCTDYIAKAQWELKSSEKELMMTRGNLLPSLSTGWNYGSGYSGLATNPRNSGSSENYRYNQQINDNRGNQLYFNLSIPIFSRFGRITSISRAKINRNIAENRLLSSKQSLYKQIQKLQSDYKNAWAHYNSKTLTLTSMEELYNYAQERFKMGLISALELRLSQSNYNKAATDLVQAKYELLFHQQMLRLMVGA